MPGPCAILGGRGLCLRCEVSGQWRPELIEQHQVARNTVRDALALLVHEGLIEARRSLGYFVRDRHRMDYRPQSDLRPCPDDLTEDVFLTTDFGIAGREPSQTIEVSIVQPPQLVAERLVQDRTANCMITRNCMITGVWGWLGALRPRREGSALGSRSGPGWRHPASDPAGPHRAPGRQAGGGADSTPPA